MNVEEASLLVWVTNPEAAGRIAAVGRRLADENGLELRIVSIQNPAGKEGWEQTVEDLNELHQAARSVDAELTVVYSDNRLQAAVKLIQQISPKAMVCGIAGNGRQNLFLDHIRSCDRSIPLYTVDSGGNAVKPM